MEKEGIFKVLSVYVKDSIVDKSRPALSQLGDSC